MARLDSADASQQLPTDIALALHPVCAPQVGVDSHHGQTTYSRRRDLPEIVGAYRMTGDLDYVLRVRVADVAGYDRFYRALIDRVPVADISASFVMEEIKETTELPV